MLKKSFRALIFQLVYKLLRDNEYSVMSIGSQDYDIWMGDTIVCKMSISTELDEISFHRYVLNIGFRTTFRTTRYNVRTSDPHMQCKILEILKEMRSTTHKET